MSISNNTGLNSSTFNREGVSRSVCCVQNEGTAFAVFHQLADTYDQTRGLVILNL